MKRGTAKDKPDMALEIHSQVNDDVRTYTPYFSCHSTFYGKKDQIIQRS